MKRRDDKSIEEASTGEELAYMYRQQERRGAVQENVDEIDED